MSLKFPPKQNCSGISTDQLLVFEQRLEGGGDVAAEVVPLEAILGRIARRPGGHPGVTWGHFWVPATVCLTFTTTPCRPRILPARRGNTKKPRQPEAEF